MPSNKFLAVAAALTTAAIAASLIVYFSTQSASSSPAQLQQSSNATSSLIAAAAPPARTAWVPSAPSSAPFVPAAPERETPSGQGQTQPGPVADPIVSVVRPFISRQPLPVATNVAVVVRTRNRPTNPPSSSSSPTPTAAIPVIVPRPSTAITGTTAATGTTSSVLVSTPPSSSSSSVVAPTQPTRTATATNGPTQGDDDGIVFDDNIIDSDAAIIIDANRGRPTSALITAVPTAVPTPPNRRPITKTASSTSTLPTVTPPAGGNNSTTPPPPPPPKSCSFSFECPASTCCAAGKCTPAAQANGGCTPFAPRSATSRFLPRPASCARPPLECAHVQVPAALLTDLARGDAKYKTPLANLTCPAQAVDRRNATQALACDTRKFTCGTCPTACGACPATPPVVRACARPGDVLLVVADAGSDFTPTLVKDLLAERVPAAWFVSGDKLVGAAAAKFGPILSAAVRASPTMALGSMGLSHALPSAFRALEDHRTDLVGAELVLSRLVPAPATLKFPRVYLAPGAANVSGAPLSLLATLGYTVVAPSVVVGDTLDKFGTPEAVMARVQGALRAPGAAPIVAVRDGSPWGMSMVRDFVKAVKDNKGRVVDLATCLGQGKSVYAATTSQ